MSGRKLTGPEQARFWSTVKISPDGCWRWTAPLIRSCATFVVEERFRLPARRLAFELASGQPPPRGLVLHGTCGERTCIRPEHARLMTNAEHLTAIRQVKP